MTTRTRDPRQRLTSGVNAARLRSEVRESARPAAFFLGGVALAVAIAIYLIANLIPTFGHDTYQVEFAVPQDFGVFAGVSDVRFRGVKVGTITGVHRSGTELVVVATLRTGQGTVYRNAQAEIRPITPLNNVYLDIVNPGTPSAGVPDPNRPLSIGQTTTSVTVPEVLDVFNPNARLGLERLLDQLGNGMADHGLALRQALTELDPFLQQAGALTRALAYRQTVTKQLIHNTAVLTGALGQRQTELHRLVVTGAQTVGTLAAGSSNLNATLAELGPTFAQLESTLTSVNGVIAPVDAGLNSLYLVADRLQGGLAALRSLNGALGPAIADLRQPVKILDPWVQELNRVSGHLQPIASALAPQVPTVNRLAQDLVTCQRGVIGFFQWNASLAKFGDQNGPLPRGNLALGIPSAGLPGEPVRTPERGCTPGLPARGVPTSSDLH